jgi:hypothetical protein
MITRKLSAFSAAAALVVSMTAQAGDVSFSNSDGSPIYSIDFGDVDEGTSTSREIILRNTSDHVIEDIFVSLGGPLSRAATLPAYLIVTCPLELLPNDTCPVTLIFNPNRQRRYKGSIEVTGSYLDATLNITHDVSESRPITGQGLPSQ